MRCVSILQAVDEGMPRPEDLAQELADADAAQARGYYLPDEAKANAALRPSPTLNAILG